MTRRRRAVIVALLLLAPIALSACGAGQVTQTATQARDRTGGQGQLGDIAVRAVHLEYPADGVHDPGDPVRLAMGIVNGGHVEDELIGVAGDAFTGATVNPPGTSAGAGETPTAGSKTSTPEAPAVGIPLPVDETVLIGKPDDPIFLTGLTEPIGAAYSVPLTLTFARAGELSVMAITEPAPARPRAPAFDFHAPES
jgi:hypothetical protein